MLGIQQELNQLLILMKLMAWWQENMKTSQVGKMFTNDICNLEKQRSGDKCVVKGGT